VYPGALVKDVADAVGFNDLSYFIRAFKRQSESVRANKRRAQDCLND
jgi:AraC-like DNA-binding protein